MDFSLGKKNTPTWFGVKVSNAKGREEHIYSKKILIQLWIVDNR
jgi:hypothetical protein